MPNTRDMTGEGGSSILVVGDSGTHKTWLIGTCPKPYVFDFDKGMLTLRGKDVSYDTFIDAPIGSKANPKEGVYPYGTAWTEFIKKFNEIGGMIDKGTCPYLTLGLDSLTMLAECAMAFVLRQAGRDTPQLQDWGKQITMLKMVIQQLTAAPLLSVLTAHVQRTENDLTQTVEKLPLVTGKFAGLVPVLFDEVYFTDVKVAADKSKKYSLITSPTPSIKQAKSRLNVPDGTDTDYAAIAKYFGTRTA